MQGLVHGLSEPADVTLLRIETCPSGRLATPISACDLSPDGDETAFELPIPLATPPPVAGPRCRLSFAVRARSPVSGRRRGQVLVPVEISGGERPMHETMSRHDRVIASFPAHHFPHRAGQGRPSRAEAGFRGACTSPTARAARWR